MRIIKCDRCGAMTNESRKRISICETKDDKMKVEYYDNLKLVSSGNICIEYDIDLFTESIEEIDWTIIKIWEQDHPERGTTYE